MLKNKGLLIMVIVAIILSCTVFILGYLIGNKLLLPEDSERNKESKRDPLTLRPFAFEVDIAEGAIDSSLISSSKNKVTIAESVKEVCNQKIGSLKRRHNKLNLNRIVNVSEDSRRDKVIELLVKSDLAFSKKQKREIMNQLRKVMKPDDAFGVRLSVVTLNAD